MSTAQETKTRAVNLTDDQLSDLISAANLADDEERSAGTYTGVIRLLNAAQSATWQSEPPKEDGWYWWRETAKSEAIRVRVYSLADARYARYTKHTETKCGEYMFEITSRKNGEWWPIPSLEPPV